MISLQTSIDLFYQTLRIRLIEEAIAKAYKNQEMRCPVHLSVGQEAVAVGVCASLAPEDYVMSTHRAHAHYLAKGADLNAMIAEIHGKEKGCTSGKGGSMHLVDLEVGMKGCTPIVGGSLPVAVGLAFADYMKKNNRVTVIFFGEGMTEEGVFCESLNFAALKKLPILFVCENNLYSVYSPLDVRQPVKRDLCKIVEGHGIEAHKGNGNDLEEVYSYSSQAVEKIRLGQGPQFLELNTYRWLEHCGPNFDNHIGYRTEEEFLKWKETCPIESYKKHLFDKGLLTDQTFEQMKAEIQHDIDQAFEFAKESPWPSYDPSQQGLYASKGETCHATT